MYQQVLAEAQKVFSDVDASKEDVQKVTSKLEKSLSELKKADKLTTLKVIVRDANGNLFTRPFKFQYTSDKEGYNSYSDAYTGIMYLPASAAWKEGETWKLFPCYQELYSADPVINFTVGKENGKSYFKEINGETVGVDYEKEITVTWTGIETPGFEPRTPDNTVLKEVIEQMKAYTSEVYTPASFEALTQAINKSEETAGKADATQEDYNAAVAELKKAAADLKMEANKVALGKEIAYKTSYSQANYTKVDGEDVGNGKEVIFILTEKTVPVVDKSMLQAKVNEVKDMKQGDYTLNSYKAFKTAIAEAETALDNPNATQQDVDQALSVLEEAQNNLKTVRGMRTLTIAVSSEDGSQLQSNIKFIRDNVYYNVQNTMFANDGTLVWKLTGYEDAGEYEIYLPEDSVYIATPAVTKITIGKEDGTSVVEKINGVPAAEAQAGIRLLAKSTDACDKVTFRAYVQDEDGKILPGISFNVLNGDPQVLTSDENGMIQYDVTVWDIDTDMTVSLQANDQWSCDKQVIFTVSEDPEVEGRGVIRAIDGTAFAGGEKIVFVLRDKNKPQPVDKTGLEGAIKEAQAIEKDLYTEESYGVMEQALANALTVDRDDNATQENIDSAAQALRDAMNGLVKKEVPQPVNKEALGKAIKEAQALKKDDYTDASFTAFENALKNAVAINENAVATQEEVNNAEKTLRDAIAGLVKKDGETPTPNPEDKNQNKPNSNQQKPSDTNQTSNNTQLTNAAQNTTVKTGDTANFMIPIAGIGMAAILLVLAIVLRKKYRR